MKAVNIFIISMISIFTLKICFTEKLDDSSFEYLKLEFKMIMIVRKDVRID